MFIFDIMTTVTIYTEFYKMCGPRYSYLISWPQLSSIHTELYFFLPDVILEYIVFHNDLPTSRPHRFSLSLQWSDDGGDVTNLTLNLQKNSAVNDKVPLYSYDDTGAPRLTGVTKLKVSHLHNILLIFK